MVEALIIDGAVMPPAPDPTTPSVAKGGTFYRGEIAGLPVRIGIWRYTDIFVKEEKMRSKQPELRFDIVRVNR